MQVTKNFKLSELEFSDKIPPELIAHAVELLQNLQVIRDHFQKPVTIISGYRSPARNEAVGGAKKSQHMEAKAADIKIAGVPTEEVSISALTAVITALYPAVKFLSAYDRRIAILEEQQMTLSKKHDKTEHELHTIQRDINKICVTLERIETNIEHLKDKKFES
jgi:hypothetical protein